MSLLRETVKGVFLFLLAFGLGVVDSQAAVFTTQDLEVLPEPAGAIRLRFAADDSVGGTVSVQVYRMVSSTTPLASTVVSSGQLILSSSTVTSGQVKELLNVSNDVDNQANGFLPSTNTVNTTRYWYVVVASETGQPDTNSRVRGGTADMNQPQTFSANEFVASCTDGTSVVSLSFVNPSDEVIDFDSDPAMSPGTVQQVAVPYDNYRINYRLYEVTGSELFDVNNDPVSGNAVDLSPVTPYVVGNTTMFTRTAPGGTALSYGMRIIDTVGNEGGGSPLSQNNTTNGQAVPGVVTPPTDVTVSETMLGGVPVTAVTFTINTASLVSDPADSDPAIITIYGRIGSTPITSADLGSATILSTTTRNNSNTAEVITFYHTPSTPGLPRTTGSTISYAATITTDNGKTSCVSNSPNLTTTDILPPQLVEIATPTDGQKVNGVFVFSATVQDDAAGGGITDTTFTINPGNILAGVDMTDFVGAASGVASISYDTTLLADGTYILSVTAADFANNTLATGSGDPGAGPNVTFLVDNTPPTVAITSPAAESSVDGFFTVSGTASDANATIVAVTLTYTTSGADGSLLATGTNNWSGTVPVDAGLADDAIITVTAEALDDCGLIGVATSTFCVDTDCGTVVFVQPAAPTVVGPDGLVVEFNADDDDSGGICDAGVVSVTLTNTNTGANQVFIPTFPPQEGTFNQTSTLTLADLGIGSSNHGETHTIQLSLQDGATDVPHSCTGGTETITVDLLPPDCALSAPVGMGPFGMSVAIVGDATDNGAAGMGTVEVVVELSGVVQASTTFSGSGSSLSFATNFAPLTDGVYDILVYATDTVGNGTVCESISVLIDAGGPTVAILTPPDGTIVNGSFLVTGTAQDVGSGVADVSVEYTTSGGSAIVQASGFTVGATLTNWFVTVPVDSLLADDAVFDVTAIAADVSGQTDSATGSYFVDNVASAPVISMPTPGGSYFMGAAGLAITQDASDDDTGSLDAGFELLYFANDLNSVTFEVASFDPPQVPSSGNGPFSYTLVPGATQAGLPAGQFVLGLADGDIAVVSSCFVDGATSVSNIGCATFEVVVDLTPPTCTVLAPADGACFDDSNTILGASDVVIQAMDSSSGLAYIWFRLEDQNGSVVATQSQAVSGNVATATFSYPFTSLPDGTFTLISAATDQVGNGTDCDSITVIRSSLAPISVISSPFRAIVNGSFTASGVSVTPSFATGTVGIPSATRSGGADTLLSLRDDDYVEVDFPGDFVFPFFGQLYDRMYVGSNGYITFGFGDDSEVPTVADFTGGPPRIALFWRDMNPDTASGGSGEIRVQFQRQSGDFANDRVHVRFIDVPSVSSGGMVLPQVNSVTATLYVSGAIELDYGTVNGASGTLVGVSPGFGASSTFTDLGDTTNTMSGSGYYEQFTTSSPSDLVDGSFIRFIPTADLVGTQAATAVEVWYPGPGGTALPPLSASTTAAATLTQVPFTGAIDEAIEIPFTLGFEFPFYGACWNSVYINNHGFLEFGGTITGVSPNPQNPTDSNINQLTPKVMGLYSDIDGDAGGGTWYRQFNDRFQVMYVGVPSTAGSGVNDVTITLYETGAVDIEWGNTDILTTNDVAVGISAGVFGQSLSGYTPTVTSNGVDRTSLDLSTLGSPVVVSDMAMFERFPAAGTIDLGPVFQINGSAGNVSATVDTDGNWSASIAVSTIFTGDGDVFSISAKGYGGCNAQTRGPAANRIYAIDRTVPVPSFTTQLGVENCLGGTLIVNVTADDSGTAGYRIDSGICSATLEVFQGGVSLGLADLTLSVPTQPNAGPVVGTATISPASFGITAGQPFGINLRVVDCAIDLANASETYSPGSVPENIVFDPTPPASQIVCTRLFVAGPTAGNNMIWELNPDTGDILNTIDVGASFSGAGLNEGLAFANGELYYANSDAPSATTIVVLDADTGAVNRTLIPPATVTLVSGLAIDGTALIIQSFGSMDLARIDALTGAVLPELSIPGITQGPDIDAGIFGRVFLGDTSPTIYEAFDGTTINLGSFGSQILGMAFSGTRLFGNDGLSGSLIYELPTDSPNTASALNSFAQPAAATQIGAMAAGAAQPPCRLCDTDFPYQICSAATDSVACGIGSVSIYAYPASIGTASQVELMLSSFTVRATAETVPAAQTSAAIACATLTQATALQLIPSGEGDIVVYSIASDVAVPANTEAVADALTRAVTLTLDLVPPTIVSLDADPVAATSTADVTVTLTLLLVDAGTGVDLAGNPPSVTADFTTVGGAMTALPMVAYTSDTLGNVTATYEFNPSALGLSVGLSDYIDFTVSAQDLCANATTVAMADRFIIDNAAPIADSSDPFYPALDVIANGTDGGTLWAMENGSTWTLNEMVRAALWDLGFTSANPFTPASDTDVLGGTTGSPVIPEASAGDLYNPGAAGNLDAWPSGIASIELYYATSTATATPSLSAFTNLIGTASSVVTVTGGGTTPLSVASAGSSGTATWSWVTENLTPTMTGSDDYYYLKTVTRDGAGNRLDPIFGPFLLADLVPPEAMIITAEALFGTPDVRIDWERVPVDNVGVVGYEIFRTRDPVDDVLEANPFTDFDPLDVISAYDDNGEPILEYLDRTVPPAGTYAYYVVAFDAAGNGRTGSGVAGNISNIVAAAPNDLVDPFPVTNLKVRAGEPDDGIILSWGVPDTPPGGGPSNPLGDNVGISVWEIFRAQRSGAIANNEITDGDGDIIRDPDLLIATVVNQLVPDMTSPTGTVRNLPYEVVGEKATINGATPNQIVLFMPPIDASAISKVFNQTTGETYTVVAATAETVEISGTQLPQPGDTVLVDYVTDRRVFVDTNVIPGLPYSYAVVARDAAGNRSIISTSELPGDATAVAFDTTPPEPIASLQASPVAATTHILLQWDRTPQDGSGIVGYNALRSLGTDPLTVASDVDHVTIAEVLLPPIRVAPTSATMTLTLPTSDIDKRVFWVIDTTRKRFIPAATDVTDVTNDANYVLSGDQLTVRNIPQSLLDPEPTSGSFYHNLEIVAFRSDGSLYNGSGFDGQMQLLDTTPQSGRTYNYAVMGVDVWGNVAPLSNSAQATANDVIPPVTPLVSIEENCAGVQDDYVVASVTDDDVEEIRIYSDSGLTNLIAHETDENMDRQFRVSIGDNLYGQVWVVVEDFANNQSPVVMVSNDIVPPASLTESEVAIVQNPPGTDDFLVVTPTDPDTVRVNVYRDDSLQNLVASAYDSDDGVSDGVWMINVGDNLAPRFYVTALDEVCNESDDFPIDNLIDASGLEIAVTVNNNATGTRCLRTPIEDTLDVWFGAGVAEICVYRDAAETDLLVNVSTADAISGPSGGRIFIPIGDNNSFTPGSLDSVWIVPKDAAGNRGNHTLALIDIQAPEIAELEVFSQVPFEPGLIRAEDEVSVDIDFDTATDSAETLCVKIFSEDPTLARQLPTTRAEFLSDVRALGANATGHLYAADLRGASGVANDAVVRIDPAGTTSDFATGLLEPTAIAVTNEGLGEVWIASRNPGATATVRLTVINLDGTPNRTVDTSIPAPVAGMTIGQATALYIASGAEGGDVYLFDTNTDTESILIASPGGELRGIAWDGEDTVYISRQVDLADPTSGQILAYDLTSLVLNVYHDGIVEVGGLIVDRLGGLHYAESGGTDAGGRAIPPRVREIRPIADGPLTLFSNPIDTSSQPDSRLVGPVIDSEGNLVVAATLFDAVVQYRGARRSSVLIDPGLIACVPENAVLLAQRVPGSDFRVDNVKIGDNEYHTIQAAVVDQAGNYSNIIALGVNDVVGPVITAASSSNSPPGTEDELTGQTEPFAWVRAYSDPGLQNRIDREDNSFRADANGNFGPLLIGDNLIENVWVAAMDEAGNVGDPILVVNDIVAPTAPDAGLITITSNCPGTDDLIQGATGSVEPGCIVRIYSDEFLGTVIAETTADPAGAFGPVSIGDNLVEVVYVTCTDSAGNESEVTVLDGVAGKPINDIQAPEPVNLDEVDLIQEADGEDFVVIGPGATDLDVVNVRVFTDSSLTTELSGGLSPIAIPATGPQSIGVNVGIAGVVTGFERVWLVAEDGACNRSQPVSIDLDVEVEVSDPADGLYVFNADEPNNNTLAGLEAAVDSNIEVQIGRGIANAGNATLDVPLLGTAHSDEAGAFQPVDLGRVAQATSYLVGIDSAGNRSVIVEIDTQDRVPPPPPNKDRIVLVERTRSFQDTIRGLRGAVGRPDSLGEEVLYLRAYSDASLTQLLPDFPVEIPAAGFNDNPAPGSFPETPIGDNHANNDTDPPSIVGTSSVWLTAADEFGNESEAVVCQLDVETPNPDPTKIYVFSENPQIESFIIGQNWAVEPGSEVLVTSDPEGLCVIASIHADDNGAWPAATLGPILRKPDTYPDSFPHPTVRDEIYIRSIDPAGNRSALIAFPIEVVTYAVLDAFGGITLRNGLAGMADTLQPTLIPDGIARDIEPGYFRADGSLVNPFAPGDPVLPEFTGSPAGFYRMTGLGAVEALGDVLPVDMDTFTPFSSDLAKDIEVLPSQNGAPVAFYMLSGDGLIRSFGGAPALEDFPLPADLARDLELDYNPDGTLKGGYILDARGALIALGDSEDILPYGLYFPDLDVFVDVELVRDPDTLETQASLELTNYGLISIAGTVDEGVVDGIPYFGFNIARDLEISYDSETNRIRGVYVLDGYGGIHAGGEAPTIHDAPFFGFDVARDLELFRDRTDEE